MRRRTTLVAIGGTLALTIGVSTAYAAIAGNPVSAGGVSSGCYTNAEVNGSGTPLFWTTRTWTSGPGSLKARRPAVLNSAIARATQVSGGASGTDAARCAGRR